MKNLQGAVNYVRSEINRQKSRDYVVRQFDAKPLDEKQYMFKKYRGRSTPISSATDYDKLKMMGYFNY